jgi:hypothetical protein
MLLVPDLQVSNRVLAHPFTHRVSLVRGWGCRLVRVDDARGFPVGGRGSGAVEVVLLF